MTTQPPSNMSRKSHRKTGIKKNDLAGQSKREPEPVKKDSTEYIVSQLMDPKSVQWWDGALPGMENWAQLSP